jgi:hypothetical protein
MPHDFTGDSGGGRFPRRAGAQHRLRSQPGGDDRRLAKVLTQLAYTTMANLVPNVAGTPVDAAFAARA